MSQHKDVAISVKGLHKSFKLPHEQYSGIKQIILGLFRKNRKKGYEIQHVLNGLDFEIEKGDFFGIVGRNGSGKSTLLKTLAGIYAPEKGSIQINGSLIPFIELGVGFNPELTGRENVFLNGALLGFSRDEMSSMYDDIVEFAELGRFMDQKLKNYSSGMQVRLAFSIAIRADGDILVLDEVLAVGDEAFQRKCREYFKELKRKGKTVILVTHSMSSVEEYCNKGILLDKGKVLVQGSNEKIALAYEDLFSEKKVAEEREVDEVIKSCHFRGGPSGEGLIAHPHEKIQLSIDIESTEEIQEDVILGINIRNSDGVIVTSLGVGGKGEGKFFIKKGKNHIRIELDNIYQNGIYMADLLLVDYRNDRRRVLYELLGKEVFVSKGFVGREHALVRPRYTVEAS